MTTFLAVASSKPACLTAFERRSTFFYTSAVGYTVENGVALAQTWEDEEYSLPFLGIYDGARYFALVANTQTPVCFAEQVARSCARYGKKMYAYAPRNIPFVAFDGMHKRFFFASCYISEEDGVLWLSSHQEMLPSSRRVDFGGFHVK